ncbi:MAG TPA: lytic transglycosylase domain-containing protein [Sphingomicrobium sp.]|nr:lytic transglycosylase domain-containing protein [Sphingomicrobium sp.]
MATLRALAIIAGAACVAPATAAPVDRWSAPIAEASARFGIPEEWIRRVIHAESGGRAMLDGRPIASSAGAMGLMQLMPGTWRDMRALLGLGSDPQDPRDNILAGTAYLRLMYRRFGYPGLFAAYNAGPARYAESLARGRPLPAETRAYVVEVASAGRPAPAVPAAAEAPRPARLFAIAPASGTPRAAPAWSRHSGSLFVELGGSRR